MNAEQARQIEHYRAVRQRLTAPRAIKPVERRKNWRPMHCQHDQHVRVYRFDLQLQEAIAATNPLPRRIMREVAEKYGVTIEDIKGDYIRQEFVVPRHEFYFRMNKEERWSLPRIARLTGRDHTTILNGVRRHMRRLNGIGRKAFEAPPRAANGTFTRVEGDRK